jgi:hypothetical protein
MGDLEPIVLGLLVAVAALSILARVIGIPYPILMVIGGLGLGLIPGAPEVALDPELVLVVFLPPLLYIGAFFTSLRDVRRDARAITMLSVGLVAATACAVAAAAHHLVGLPWAAAFTLGAIVSAHRSVGGHPDHAPARRAEAHLDGPPGRGARQRRDRSRALPRRGRAPRWAGPSRSPTPACGW